MTQQGQENKSTSPLAVLGGCLVAAIAVPVAIIVVFVIVTAVTADRRDDGPGQAVGGPTEAPASPEDSPSASPLEETSEDDLQPLFDAPERCGEASSLTLDYGEASVATIDAMLASLRDDPTSADGLSAALQEHLAGQVGADASLTLQQCIIALEDAGGVQVATPYVDDLVSNSTPVEVDSDTDPEVAAAAECLTLLSGPTGAWAWAEATYEVGRDVYVAALEGEDPFRAAEAAPARPDDQTMESLRRCAEE